MNEWHALAHWFQAALAGMATPVVIVIALVLTTLLLEDIAIAAGIALATSGMISWVVALAAVGGGIAAGDVGLYGLGLSANHVPWLRRRVIGQRSSWAIAGVVFLAAALNPAEENTLLIQRIGAWGPLRAVLPRWLRNANAELMGLKNELDDLKERLPGIRSKVVIVHGTKDNLVPLSNVPYIQARLTGARCIKTILLPGQNHFLPWNSIAVVREALRAALIETC